MIDVDYTDEATAITAHFSGFVTAHCGGMPHFEWAVGEGWGDGERESVMAFTEGGIVQTEELGSGYAQVRAYNIYTTVYQQLCFVQYLAKYYNYGIYIRIFSVFTHLHDCKRTEIGV